MMDQGLGLKELMQQVGLITHRLRQCSAWIANATVIIAIALGSLGRGQRTGVTC